MNQNWPKEKQSRATNLSLIAGIMILTNGILLGIVAQWFPNIMPTLPGTTENDPTLLLTLSAVGIVLSMIVLSGSLLLRLRPTKRRIWGAFVIAFSLPSVIMGGGFIVGFVLGVFSGIIALQGNSIQATKSEK